MATFASLSVAQTIPALPVQGPVQFWSYDVATGAITPKGTSGADAPVVSFSNSTATGSYAVPASNRLWSDWGVKATGLSTVLSFDVGYATTALDPAMGGPGGAIRVRLYSGTLGNCGPGEPGTKVYGTPLSGLPGSPDGVTAVANVVTVNLPAPVTLPDGPVGWTYGYGDGLTGPLLITVGADGTGTVDGFDEFNGQMSCLGTSTFTTAGIASFYLELTEDSPTPVASATVRNGNGVNPVDFVSTSAPLLGKLWRSEVTPTPETLGSIVMIALHPSPAPFPHPYGPGEILIDLAPFPTFDVKTTDHAIWIPKEEALLGAKFYTQALRVESSPFGPRLAAMNALDLVLGE